LITGASGFIGRRCLIPLAREGFEVHAVSFQGKPDAGESVHWHRMNLLDPATFGPLLKRLGPSHLLHAAWIATPASFWTSEENLSWLSSSIELVRQFYLSGGQRAVGVGSCAEYEWTSADCSETRTPLRPSTIYGQCKAAMSFALEAAASSAGGTAAWARLFFPYGPGEAAERFIPAVIRGLIKGETVECTHGNQVRDFVFVDDVADALVKMLTSAGTGAFNVGSGHALSLREVVAVICEKLGRADLIRFGARPSPPGDPERVVADVTRMRREIGWQPSYSIEAGIDRAIAAWRKAMA
jgi:nucleoside-diphosphate-sugar epimerase